MRKCPNCKNPLPVGARRCVHCRALVGDTAHENENASTHMGFGGGRDFDEERASSTSLGLPGSPMLSRSVDGDSRRQMSRAFDEAPHQTMLGLGPVMSNSRRQHDSNNDTMGAFSGQRTISGMPGISGFIQSQTAASARTPERPLRAVSMRPTREVATVSDEDLFAAQRQAHNVSSGNAPEIDAFEPRSSSPSFASAPAAAASVSRSDAVMDSMLGFGAGHSSDDDDPFAGLPGVAPKPSSLVDEEFVDLTSQLFGDDFAAGTSGVDDEEDGWDFDFAPAKAPAADPKPAPAPETAAAPIDKTEARPERLMPERADAAEAKPASVKSDAADAPSVKSETADAPSVKSCVPAAAVQGVAAAAAAPETADPGDEEAEAMSTMADFVLKAAAYASCMILLLWAITACKDELWKNGAPAFLMFGIVAFCLLCNGLFLALFKKIKGIGLAAILIVASLALIFGVVRTHGDLPHIVSLALIPIAIQVISAIWCAAKK